MYDRKKDYDLQVVQSKSLVGKLQQLSIGHKKLSNLL